MAKARCQACRRRKVRCDETKPICRACERLDLSCVYGPALGSSTPEASKYRVRFVNSPYSRSVLESSAAAPSNGQSGAGPTETSSVEASVSPTVPDTRARGQQPVNLQDLSASGEYVEADPLANITSMSRGDPEQSSHEVISPQQDASTWDPGPMPLMGVPGQANFPNQQAVFLPQDLSAPDAEGAMGMMPMPAFFDLNMNFDSLSDDWMAFPSAPVGRQIPRTTTYREEENQSPSSEASGVVSITPADHGLIQHYLNVMSQYTKMRSSGDENMYTQIFSNMALFYPPLYHAIMAWTGIHLGQSKRQTRLVTEAEQRNSRAVVLLHQDQEIANHLELALVTIWFALQFELLAARGIDSFCLHLEFAADLIDACRRQARNNDRPPNLNPISSRVLSWLGSYDARASWIGGTGRLLQSLEMYRSDYDFLDAAFPDPSQDKASSISDLKSSLRANMELDMVDNRIALLHRRVITAPAAVWSQVVSDLLSMQERLETASPTAAALETILHKGTRSVKAYYSVIIEFHGRLLPASVVGNLEPSKLITAQAAADRIIRISAWVNRLRLPSPQNIWLRILFLAGIETTDLVQQDWVLRTFADAERWGGNFTKARVLLEFIIKEQGDRGTRIDYLDAMKRSTGLFII
ncbi:uncharacterized protein E0L32_011344 [Thyridium curvatum]|uniref:Zn(2)-C6 fungal-type domain-containing protein n=1 Tax=Thyridium curvatum TaxID=1093900 RepID=A0A507BNT6_9PEZI|nr:uncharacterized protein E0L32_011344 [Thyridium curvatum]TPX18951.1 hypothetical protein E0L32_011344 [Thyridium curvatum]